MNEKQLYNLWKKYIDVPMYRAMPKKHLKNLKKNGLESGNDPHKEVQNKIRELEKIIDKLEKKGFIMMFNWGAIDVSGSYAIKTTIIDFEEGYIDFTPNLEEAKHYLKLEGGALVSTLIQITLEIISKKFILSEKEKNLVIFLNKWANQNKCKNVIIKVLGSSQSFEKALILPRLPNKNRKIRKRRKHLRSFFGSYQHFKKLYLKNPDKYLIILEEKRYYLRLRDKIPAKEIKVLK